MKKIVTDTNIWYKLASEPELFEAVKDLPLAPNHTNIYELCTSFNLLNAQDEARKAVQKMFYFKQNVLLEPALIYIAKLKGGYDFDYSQIKTFLTFTELFAKGHEIKEEEKTSFKEWLQSIDDDLQKATDIMNGEKEMIHKKIEDRKAHREKDTEQITLHFINMLVETGTNKETNLKNFDFTNVELLLRVVDYYFKELETTGMKMDVNDWFDFSILGYVQPGDQFWTYDKRWLRMIKGAKMEHYLFTP